MFLNFGDSDIINLDNVAIIEVEEYYEDEVAVIVVTTAITFHHGDGLLVPKQLNALRRKYVIKNEKWFELLDMMKRRDTFVCS